VGELAGRGTRPLVLGPVAAAPYGRPDALLVRERGIVFDRQPAGGKVEPRLLDAGQRLDSGPRIAGAARALETLDRE
jgi:hypothetical protein